MEKEKDNDDDGERGEEEDENDEKRFGSAIIVNCTTTLQEFLLLSEMKRITRRDRT